METAYYFKLKKWAFECPTCEHINETDVCPGENNQATCKKCGGKFAAEEDKNVIYAEDIARTIRGIAVGAAISVVVMLVCVFIGNMPF